MMENNTGIVRCFWGFRGKIEPEYVNKCRREICRVLPRCDNFTDVSQMHRILLPIAELFVAPRDLWAIWNDSWHRENFQYATEAVLFRDPRYLTQPMRETSFCCIKENPKCVRRIRHPDLFCEWEQFQIQTTYPKCPRRHHWKQATPDIVSLESSASSAKPWRSTPVDFRAKLLSCVKCQRDISLFECLCFTQPPSKNAER